MLQWIWTILRVLRIWFIGFISFPAAIVLGYFIWDTLLRQEGHHPDELSTSKEKTRSKDSDASVTGKDKQQQHRTRTHPPPPAIYRAGYLVVRRTYEPSAALAETGHSTPSSGIDAGQPVSDPLPTSDAASVQSTGSTVSAGTTGSNPTTSSSGWSTSLATSYRSFMDSRKQDAAKKSSSNSKGVKDRYFAVLRGPTLLLYDDEEQLDSGLRIVIKLPLHEVDVFPRNLIDGELFMKRNAICLTPILPAGGSAHHESPSVIRRPISNSTAAVNGADTAQQAANDFTEAHGGYQPYYLFPAINHDKEDWLHSLVASSRMMHDDLIQKDADLFRPEDVSHFVESIDDQPDSIPVRWLNAIIGRLFFSVYRTSAVQDYIHRKLMRKLAKVNRPGFLGDIKVETVDVGNTAPSFSRPMLKELTVDGDASMEIQVKYTGCFKLTIGTTVSVPSITRKEPWTFSVVLSAIIRELEGTMVVRIKRPPTNRIWYAFTTMPRIVLDLEPVLGPRQVKWSMITKPIESRLRELIAESMVLPHMDDIAFMDTKAYTQRGGIYADCIKREEGDPQSTSAGTTVSASGNGAPIPLNPADGEATDGRAANGQESLGLMPGVPNLKLGDDRGENVSASSAMRQRPARDRKHSDPASIKSTQSLPIGEQFKLSSMFGNGSGIDGTSAAALAAAAAKEHSRKRSWFASAAAAAGPIGSSPSPSPISPSSGTAAAKTRLAASESDTALPLAQNSTNAAAEVHGTETLVPRPSGRGTPRKSEPVGLRGPSDISAGDGVAERLRGILETGGTPSKVRSASNPFPETATPPSEVSESSTSLAKLEVPVTGVAGSSASPSGIARTTSASSDETTVNSAGPASATSAHSSADYARYLEETAAAARNTPPGLPSLFRRKSDKTALATSPAASSSTSTVGNGVAPDTVSVLTSTSASDASTLASSTHSSGGSGSLGAGGSALLSTWKQKAADKQAIQDGVAQAKQQMAKWSNKWSTYRRQAAQPTSPHPDDDPLAHGVASEDEQQAQGSSQAAANTDASAAPTGFPPSSASASSLHGLAEGGPTRSRSGSILSSSPTGRFQPVAPIATTSLTTVGGVTAGATDLGGASRGVAGGLPPSGTPISTGPSVRRVPPPSVIPVHPAFSNFSSSLGPFSEGSPAQHAKRASVSAPGRAAGYGRTTMMAVPVMDDSRKFGLSSDDLAKREQQQQPASSSGVAVPALPRRPVPDLDLMQDGEASREAVQPPLPARPVAVNGSDGSVSGLAIQAADGPHLPPRPVPGEKTAESDSMPLSPEVVQAAFHDPIADPSAQPGVPALPSRAMRGGASDAGMGRDEETRQDDAEVPTGPPLPPRPLALESASPLLAEPSDIPGFSVEPPTPSPRG